MSQSNRGMPPTQASRRDVFRMIAAKSYWEWPAYGSTPLYDRSSLSAFEEDARTVAGARFDYDAHESVEFFVTNLPLAYVDFEPYDRYTGISNYEMEQLVRALVFRELYGVEHESTLAEYLGQNLLLFTHPNHQTSQAINSDLVAIRFCYYSEIVHYSTSILTVVSSSRIRAEVETGALNA